jgi:hypothetical protein
MIPKIIHYCWFGGKPLTDLAQKCIRSWEKHCPDYIFMIWDETNFNVNSTQFTAQIANIKKWGFIVDYIRVWAVYHFGGIYLDTDVELIKSLDDLLNLNICFAGFEDMEYINPGSIFAGEKGCIVSKEIMEYYSEYNIYRKNKKLDLIPSPKIYTKLLLKYGLIMNNQYQKLELFTAYPTDYFSPKSIFDDSIEITTNTYSIHHYEGSWLSKQMKQLLKEKSYINNNIKYKKLGILLKKICVLKKIIFEKINI